MSSDAENPKCVSPDPSAKKHSNSRPTQVLLIVLSMLYFVASISAFIVVAMAPRNQSTLQMRPELIRHGIQHAVIVCFCVTACILVSRRSKLAELATGLAAYITGLVAL